MSAWKQWFVEFINNRPADDDWVEVLIDFLGLWPVWGSIIAIVVIVFASVVIHCEMDYRKMLKD